MKFEENSSVSESQFKNQKYNNVLATIVRSGVRTHALFREPELKSDALDRSAILTPEPRNTMVKVSNHGRHVMSSIPVPPKARRVGQRCTLNLSRAETSSRWCGVVVRRGGASSGVVHVT
ncbi:hypothetical protein TNCV_2974261 [Trichonephila clavipes]|nr:hypothetical protein TNCV_2974261 [Trichonephila clavipes]